MRASSELAWVVVVVVDVMRLERVVHQQLLCPRLVCGGRVEDRFRHIVWVYSYRASA